MVKITYNDKTDIITQPVPNENKVTASDMNEIKASVNQNVDALSLKADINGNPLENFSVAEATNPSHAINKDTFDNLQNQVSGLFNGNALFSASNEAEMTAEWNRLDGLGETPIDGEAGIFREDLNQFWKWNSSLTAKGEFSRNNLEVENGVVKDSTKLLTSGDAYLYLKNKVFVYNNSLTDEEKTIQEAFKTAIIWGANVDASTEDYYIHKLFKNREIYNDSYVQIKRTDGTLVALISLGVIPNNVGVVEYTINDYLSGYNFKFSIDWDIIPNNTVYNGGLTKLVFDSAKIYIKDEQPKTELPTYNKNEISNSVFIRNDENVYTDEELSIRKAFLKVEIWGDNVSNSEGYYLDRLGYNTPTNNKIIFEIKDESDVKIGELEIDKTSADVGVKEYVVNDDVAGYNFKILINWNYIEDATNYTSGTLAKMRFDISKCHIQKFKAIPDTSTNKVLKVGEKVYIASKWSNTHDLLITFNKCMFNNLMTFSSVTLVENTDKNILEQFTKGVDIVLNEVVSDNIGPYTITGVSSWVGGNHGFEGAFDNLTSSYTSGDSVLNVTDGTKFCTTGGWARTGSASGFLKFQYTAVSGNQLTGVTGLNTNLNASNEVQVYAITAVTDSFEFYVNGNILDEGIIHNTDELIVTVRNTIYDSSTFNYSDGSMDVALYENVTYRVSEGNIETVMQNEFAKAINIQVYYGMQLLSGTWQQKVYQANAQSTIIKGKADYINASTPWRSGDPFTYQSDKMIIAKSNDIYCCAMWFDPNCGYSQNKANYLDVTDYLWNGETNGKFYHGTILKDVAFTQGQKEWWRGVYTWFPNPTTITDASYAYKMKVAGTDYLCVDFHSAGNDVVLDLENIGKEVEEIRVDNTISVDSIILPNGLEVRATGYGSGLYKIKK